MDKKINLSTFNLSSYYQSAQLLLTVGHYEPALCLICCIMDKCAKTAYPNITKNSERFKKWLSDNLPTITRYGLPSTFNKDCLFYVGTNIRGLYINKEGYTRLEDIIYNIRCSLVHENTIDTSITFIDDCMFTFGDNHITLPKRLVVGLLKAVQN